MPGSPSSTVLIHSSKLTIAEFYTEIWRARELLFVLIERQIRIRYKQTILGVAWILIQPLTQVFVLSLVFGQMAKLDSGGMPYPLFVFAGIVAWTLFAQGADRASGSLIANERLVTKVYFPRAIIPLAAVGGATVDASIAFVFLLIGALLGGYLPEWRWLYSIVALAGVATFAASLGLLFSGLNARFRDLQYTLPFLLQAWMYASPIVYASSIVPERFRLWYHLNPMAGLVELLRYSLFGGSTPEARFMIVSFGMIGAFACIGTISFRRAELHLADYL